MDILDLAKKHKFKVAWIALVAAILIAMYWEVGQVFVERWLANSTFYHCMLVPPLAAWLLWRRKDELTCSEGKPSAWGFVLLVMGLLLYLASARTGVRMAAGMAFPVIVAGIVGAVYGRRVLRIAALPLGLLIFAIPFPQHVIGMVAMPMQQVSAVMTGKVAPLLGLQVVQHGINLDLHGFVFVVADECSGMHSLVALLLTGVVLIELSDLRSYRKVAAIAVIPPIVLLANVVRLTVVLLIAEYFGPEMALGAVVHGFSDIIVYFTAVIAFILIIGWLREGQFETHSSPPVQAGPCAVEVNP